MYLLLCFYTQINQPIQGACPSGFRKCCYQFKDDLELFGSDCQAINEQQFWKQGCKETFINKAKKQCGQRDFKPLQDLGKDVLQINLGKNWKYVSFRHPNQNFGFFFSKKHMNKYISLLDDRPNYLIGCVIQKRSSYSLSICFRKRSSQSR